MEIAAAEKGSPGGKSSSKQTDRNDRINMRFQIAMIIALMTITIFQKIVLQRMILTMMKG